MSPEITKLDGAQRQLDAAIRMHFINEDSLAIHTLVMASIQLLRDLSKVSTSGELEARLRAAIRPGKEVEFWTAIKAPSNFLKHADWDPNSTRSDVTPAVNGHLILLACMWLGQLGRSSPETSIFVPLHLTLHPDIPVEETGQPWLQLLDRMRATSGRVSIEEHLETAREALRMVKAQRQEPGARGEKNSNDSR